jgi:flagellar FliL protein
VSDTALNGRNRLKKQHLCLSELFADRTFGATVLVRQLLQCMWTMAEETEIVTPQPKKPKRTVLLIGIVLILGMGIGGAWFFLRQRAVHAEQRAESGSKVQAVLHLEEFIVNLGDTEGGRYLRVGMELGLDHPIGKEKTDKDQVSSNALIRDTILAVLCARKSYDLLSPDGKEKLKEDLVQRLQARIPELGAKEIYFTDFLVQF